MTRHIYTRIHKYMCKYVLCTFLQKISRRYSLGVLTIVAVRQFLHTLFELLWYAGATRNVCIWVCVCLPHCAPSGRLIHFFVCAKCKCDRYARFCLAKQMCLQQMCVCGVYLFMWPALCTADAAAVNRTLTSHRDATATTTFCFSSRFQQIVSLFLVAYRCYRFASHVSFVCCFHLKPDAFSLTHTHTDSLPLFFLSPCSGVLNLKFLFARLVL